MTKEPQSGPAPEETSGDGTQQAEPAPHAREVTYLPPTSCIGSFAIPEAIDRISQANPRSLGGEIGSVLIAAATKHISFELQETKHDLRDSRGRIEILQTQLARRDIQIAVQDERIAGLTRGRHVRNLFVVFGTALVGFSIEFFRNNLVAYGWSCLVMGGAILLGTWLSVPTAKKGAGE